MVFTRKHLHGNNVEIYQGFYVFFTWKALKVFTLILRVFIYVGFTRKAFRGIYEET